MKIISLSTFSFIYFFFFSWHQVSPRGPSPIFSIHFKVLMLYRIVCHINDYLVVTIEYIKTWKRGCQEQKKGVQILQDWPS